MAQHRKLMVTGAAAVLLSLAGGASVVWACFWPAQKVEVQVSPHEGLAGSIARVTTVHMDQLDPASASPARIVWEDAYGTYLKDLMNPAPSHDAMVSVTIPQAEPGSYWIDVYKGEYRAETPASFEVLSLGGTSATSGDGSSAGSGPVDGNTFQFPRPRATSRHGSSGTEPAGHPAVPAGSDTGGAVSGSVITSVGRHDAADQAGAGVDGSHPGGGGQLVGSTADGGSAKGSDAVAGGYAPSTEVVSDLWGAFTRGRTHSEAPTLVAASPGPSAGLIIGVAAAGLVALVGGFGVSELARQRSEGIRAAR